MRSLKFMLAFVCLIVLFAAGGPVLAADRQWWNVGGVDVYGFWTAVGGKKAFVVCDPATGEMIRDAAGRGTAWINDGRYVTKQVQVLDHYETSRVEDWNVIKKVDPVQVSMIAPNIFTDVSWDWDYYRETGQMRRLTSSGVGWPGPAEGYLIPGSDPDYWLVVAEVVNPNPWPVRARVGGDISSFREGFASYHDAQRLAFDKEMILGAYESKYVLINRGKVFPTGILAKDTEWSGSDPQKQQSWSEGYCSSDILENTDPELPAYLRPNKGFARFMNYGGPPVPVDLIEEGIDVCYTVQCRPDVSRPPWYFTGSVELTENGWVAHPGSGSTNPEAGKQAVEAFFDAHWPDVPHVGKDDSSRTVDGIRFSRCEPTGNSPRLYSGPSATWYDLPGPAIADFQSSQLELNSGYEKMYSVRKTDEVGWTSRIPALRYTPVFIEMYRALPTGEPGIVELVKEVSPGYRVEADEVKRPYVTQESQVLNHSITKNSYGSGKNRYWAYDVDITLQLRFTAVNPDDAKVTFEGCQFVLPNLRTAVDYIEDYIADHLDACDDTIVTSPNYEDDDYDPLVCNAGTVTLNPYESKVVYDGEVTVHIRVPEKVEVDEDDDDEYEYISSSLMNTVITSAINTCFNWSGEACFKGSGVRFTLDRTGTDIVSLNVGCGKYKDSKIRFVEFGVPGSRYSYPLSYFNAGWSPTDGQCLRLTDELWQVLWGQAKFSLSGLDHRDGRFAFGDFWPVMYWNSKSDAWTTTLHYST